MLPLAYFSICEKYYTLSLSKNNAYSSFAKVKESFLRKIRLPFISSPLYPPEEIKKQLLYSSCFFIMLRILWQSQNSNPYFSSTAGFAMQNARKIVATSARVAVAVGWK